MFSIEVDGKSGWLQIGTCRSLEDAKAMMRHFARELEHDMRIARYRPTFKVLMYWGWEAEAAA